MNEEMGECQRNLELINLKILALFAFNTIIIGLIVTFFGLVLAKLFELI